MKRKFCLFCSILLVSLTLCACHSGNSGNSKNTGSNSFLFKKDELPRIDGSTANIYLALLVLQRVSGISEEEAYGLTQFTTTENAYGELLNGNTDILLVYEGTADENTDKLEIHPIGQDALVFLVNQSNPVNNLTVKQIQDIYSDKIKGWNSVGGSSAKIQAYQRSKGSGSQVLMEKLVMNGIKMGTPVKENVLADMGGLIEAIASFQSGKDAIGYSVYYYVENMYKNSNVKCLSIGGVAPGNKTIKDGSYPFINDFYAVIRKDEPTNSSARKLLNWLLSEDGKQAVEDAGYVSAK